MGHALGRGLFGNIVLKSVLRVWCKVSRVTSSITNFSATATINSAALSSSSLHTRIAMPQTCGAEARKGAHRCWAKWGQGLMGVCVGGRSRGNDCYATNSVEKHGLWQTTAGEISRGVRSVASGRWRNLSTRMACQVR
eukprot:6744288-Alexandrium_andersonii.AAC.1